jgi:hypothetical protein
MPKHLAALLSIFGLASSVAPAEAQVLKGSQPAPNEKTKATQTVSPAEKGKLQLNQQTVRELSGKKAGANAAVAQNTGTCRYSEGCQTQNKVATPKAQAATPPPAQKLTLKQENLRNATDKSAGQLTKGNQQITKGNQQITKGNQQITKGDQQITKGNQQQITKGNQQITKGNQQITKGNQQQITKGNQQITKGNQQITK